MIQKINFHIKELEDMKKYPENLFYIGNTNLLKKQKISIVGSRKPNNYAKNFTSIISQKLSSHGICIVSGVAMGVDALAHKGAGYNNTIAVVANGLDIKYPAVNKNIISNIEQNGLMLSQFPQNKTATKYNFVLRNEVVVALGDCLIVTYADLNSGSLRSVEFALKMKKKIFVLPHRIGESEGTNKLLKDGLAEPIYDINEFVSKFSQIQNEDGIIDDFLQYCQNNPTYDEAVEKYSQKVFEYELLSKIKITNGIISVL